jgi:hypothetical protein
MKSLYFLTLFVLVMMVAKSQVAISEDGSAPNAGAMLEIKSTSKGLLLPRMTTAQRTTAGVLAKGMFIYDTDLNTAVFSNGGSWDQAINTTNIVNYVWGSTGSGGTNPSTNFIGTTDNTNLIFKTNNIERMRLTTGGDLGIGITPSSARLHIYETKANTTGSSINNYFNSKNAVTLTGSSSFTNSGGSRIDVSSSNTDASNVIKGQMITLKTIGSAAADSVVGLEINLNNSSTGTTTIEYGIKVSDISPQNGTLTNTVGLYIGDMTSGTQTNAAYAIYSSDPNAKNYFGGLLLGTTNIAGNNLNVAGGAVIGSGYAGINTAPTSGLMVEGQTGIGAVGNRKLDVAGGMAIGASYAGLSAAPTNGLIVEGDVGVGTPPVNKLDIEGNVAIGAGYAGAKNAPANGLIVPGQVGIGTNTPTIGYELDVNGDVSVSGVVNMQNGYQGPFEIYSTATIVPRGNNHVIVGNNTSGFTVQLDPISKGQLLYIMADPAVSPNTYTITNGVGATVIGGGTFAVGVSKTCISNGATTWYCW